MIIVTIQNDVVVSRVVVAFVVVVVVVVAFVIVVVVFVVNWCLSFIWNSVIPSQRC
jgi:hypothetical protein